MTLLLDYSCYIGSYICSVVTVNNYYLLIPQIHTSISYLYNCSANGRLIVKTS